MYFNVLYDVLPQLPVLLEQEDMAFMPINMSLDDDHHLQSIVDDNIANKVMCYFNYICTCSPHVIEYVCILTIYCVYIIYCKSILYVPYTLTYNNIFEYINIL